jgi:hypothetical protein
VVGDASPLALATARARLLRANAAFVVEGCGPPRVVERRAEPELDDPSIPMAAAPVEVKTSEEGEHLRVELVAPREPLAWAIDVAHDPARPFRTAWHSERSLGARVRGVVREALVPSATGPLAVRVWFDNGATATHVVPGPTP